MEVESSKDKQKILVVAAVVATVPSLSHDGLMFDNFRAVKEMSKNRNKASLQVCLDFAKISLQNIG